MKNNEFISPIGIVDSGIGGLSVAQAIMKKLPNENILYIGDTKNMPYGKKSFEQISQYTRNLLDFLINENAKVSVIACNTATAASQQIIHEYRDKIKIFNVIEPVVEYVALNCEHKKVGLICTDLTYRSGIFERLIDDYDKDIKIVSLSASNLADLVENELERSNKIESTIKEYLYHHQFRDMETVILGCTHYSWVKDFFIKVNPYINWIDASSLLADHINKYLHDSGIENNNALSKSNAIFCQTGDREKFFSHADKHTPSTFVKKYLSEVNLPSTRANTLKDKW